MFFLTSTIGIFEGVFVYPIVIYYIIIIIIIMEPTVSYCALNIFRPYLQVSLLGQA